MLPPQAIGVKGEAAGGTRKGGRRKRRRKRANFTVLYRKGDGPKTCHTRADFMPVLCILVPLWPTKVSYKKKAAIQW